MRTKNDVSILETIQVVKEECRMIPVPRAAFSLHAERSYEDCYGYVSPPYPHQKGKIEQHTKGRACICVLFRDG